MAVLESGYIKAAVISLGVMKFLPPEERSNFSIELICDEALKTSEIEGEILNRDSVRSSVIQEFGFGKSFKQPGIKPEERGIAIMMSGVYKEYKAPLTHGMLSAWHSNLMTGRYNVQAGQYRTHGF